LQEGSKLRAGASNISDLSTVTRNTVSDFCLDDLLGLGPDQDDASDKPAQGEPKDPFQVMSHQASSSLSTTAFAFHA
jgi:hypothetical protein